jgi:oligopeptide transport system permease protein
MLRFIVRRLLVTIPTILVVITITWALIKLAPGNFYSGEKPISPAIEQAIREKYGLDKPWYQQYGKTMWGILRHLDFGTSLRFEGQSVNSIIKRSLPVSAAVGILAYILALVVGITAGSIAALKQNSKWDYGSMALAMVGISVPNFVLGPILVIIFSLWLYWFPPSRWNGFPSRNLVLPVLTLSAVYIAYIARLTRAGMLEVLRSDYIRTARAKGRRYPACAARRTDARCVFHWTSTRVLADWNGGRRKNLCVAGFGKLFHPGVTQSRRAIDHRHRRVHRTHTLNDEFTG